MELEDYGEIRHKHTHIHTVPKIHEKTLNTALNDWCKDVFDEEKCKSLNVSNFDEILTGSNDEIHLSKTFSNLLSLENIKFYYSINEGSFSVNIKFFIKGTRLFIVFTKDENVKEYKSEILYDRENDELFAHVQVNLKGYGNLSGIFQDGFENSDEHPLRTIKVTIHETGFSINGGPLGAGGIPMILKMI